MPSITLRDSFSCLMSDVPLNKHIKVERNKNVVQHVSMDVFGFSNFSHAGNSSPPGALSTCMAKVGGGGVGKFNLGEDAKLSKDSLYVLS